NKNSAPGVLDVSLRARSLCGSDLTAVVRFRNSSVERPGVFGFFPLGYANHTGGGLMEAEVPAYAKVCGILALILAIVGVVIPVFGVLFITPLAIVFGSIGLYGGI